MSCVTPVRTVGGYQTPPARTGSSKYWLKAIDNETGDTYLDAGRSLLVYKKHDGQWKIAADIDQATPDVT